MSDIEAYTFSHKELVTMMIKYQDLHVGFWELTVEFSLSAQNVIFLPPGSLPSPTGEPSPTDKASPAAIVGVTKLGIRKVAKDTPLTVDASKVNPEKRRKK